MHLRLQFRLLCVLFGGHAIEIVPLSRSFPAKVSSQAASAITEAPHVGVFIHGLFMDNFMWNQDEKCMVWGWGPARRVLSLQSLCWCAESQP